MKDPTAGESPPAVGTTGARASRKAALFVSKQALARSVAGKNFAWAGSKAPCPFVIHMNEDKAERRTMGAN